MILSQEVIYNDLIRDTICFWDHQAHHVNAVIICQRQEIGFLQVCQTVDVVSVNITYAVFFKAFAHATSVGEYHGDHQGSHNQYGSSGNDPQDTLL